jgi:surface polysaccharide O-acyltransferase-like enzyme
MTFVAIIDVTTDISEHPYWILEITFQALHKWVPFFAISFGVTGNILSFLVTTKKENRRVSTCVFMSALSVVDTGVLLAALFYRLLISHGLGKHIENRFTATL